MSENEPVGRARYVKGETIGEGTYGVVYRATDTKTNKVVAIKKIRIGKAAEGFNVTALREIKLLKELEHRHIIHLVDVFPHKKNLNLVFEFMETDLEAIIQDPSINLSPADIKSFMQMTLHGLAYCHRKWIIHRDMKPNNLLIAPNGDLKLADFGLARIFGSPNRKFTHQVFALWYRAPELLYGSRNYGPQVDVWGAACIFAELLLRRPFLNGSSDIDQLGKIFAALGTPTDAQWPDMRMLPDFMEFQFTPAPPLKSLFPMATDDALDLLSKMLTFDPNHRISAQKALEHRYFILGPAPTPPGLLPRPRPKAKASAEVRPPDVESPHRTIVLSPSKKAIRLTNPDAPGGSIAVRLSRRDDTSSAMKDDSSGPNHGAVETPGVPMSVDAGAQPRPTLNSSDRSYLRKRKLDMDMEFASHDVENEFLST